MALDTLFLDAGGVLLWPNWLRVSEVLARHGVPVAASVLAAAEPLAKRDLDVATTIKSTNDDKRGWLYFDLVLSRAGVEAPPDAVAAAWAELKTYHSRSNLWEFVPEDVPPALDRFHALGLKLLVVSNANGTLRAHLTRLGLASRFDVILDSADEGVEKPDPRIFEIALDRAAARRETTVHVGDLYHVDVAGARAAGLRGVLFDPAGLYPDADCPRVRSLGELAEAIAAGRF